MNTTLFLQGYRTEGTYKDAFLASVPTVKYLSHYTFTQPVTFFIGENGVGKSTLLEALAVANGLNPEGGTENFSFSTQSTHSTLHENMTLSRGISLPDSKFFLRAESFYNVASEIKRLDDIPASTPFISASYGGALHSQSHGESFLSVFQNRFHKNALFFLDEPEAALSPLRQIAFLKLMDEFVKNGCQFIISTHSPMLITYPQASIVEIDETGAHNVPYKETLHYTLTKQFLESPEAMMKKFFDEEARPE